jgi:hypothetical protein
VVYDGACWSGVQTELRHAETGGERGERRHEHRHRLGVREVELYALDDLGERQIPLPVIRDYVNQHLHLRRRPRPFTV